jgi:hypothetical protein
MDTQAILAAVSKEIARLEQVKRLLTASDGRVPATSFHYGVNKPHKKRVMSAEARKRIGDAQRKRWAAQKKAAAK